MAAWGSSIHVAGYTFGAFAGFSNQGNDDGFVARYTGSGSQQWVSQFGTLGATTCPGVALELLQAAHRR